MKKVTYTLEQIENIVGLLNRLEIKGIGQARTLAAAAMILDAGVITEDSDPETGAEPKKEKTAAEDRQPAAEKQQESGKPAAGSGDRR